MFRIDPIDRRLIRLTDPAGTHMYLVIGDREAALLDAGVGYGDLAGQVRALTDRPVKVILTHGHMDHAPGAGQFDQVWMSPLDEGLYQAHSAPEMRLNYLRGSARMGGLPAAAQARLEELCPPKPFEALHPLQPGDRFDLGGVTLEIHEGRGHTPGCITVLLPELRTLLLGDACNQFTFLFDEGCSTVAGYRAMLGRLDRATAGRYDRVLVCHGPGGEAPAGLLHGVMEVCDGLLRGETDAMPYTGFRGEPVCIAKAMDFSTFTRADGGLGNVVYQPERIQ